VFVYLRILGLLVPILLAMPFVLVAGLLRLAGFIGVGMRMGARVQSLWAKLSLFVLGVELDTSGEHVPREATLIAVNHLSYLDILVMSALFPSRFVAKSEIGSWPLLGPIVSLSGTLFVKRGDRNDVPRVVAEMQRTLDAGVSVTFFPEGWASRGLDVCRFHPGLFETAVRGQFPCLPVTLSYSTPENTGATAWTVGWWGPVRIGPHLARMLREGPVLARVSWAPEPLFGRDRKRLAQRLEDEVRSRFRPLRQEPLPVPIQGDPGPEEGLDGLFRGEPG
jgi:1-acyl-sn-glycerol-3-phosphate acyltransferase